MTSTASLNSTANLQFFQSLTQPTANTSAISASFEPDGQDLPSSTATTAASSESSAAGTPSTSQALLQSQALSQLLSIQEGAGSSQGTAPAHHAHHGHHHGAGDAPDSQSAPQSLANAATSLDASDATSPAGSSDQLSSWLASQASTAAA